jgi:cytochrome c-type protein NapB
MLSQEFKMTRSSILILVAVACIASIGVACSGTGYGSGATTTSDSTADTAPVAIAEREIGLDKNDIRSTPLPIVPSTSAGEPGDNAHSVGYFSEAPPVIPHLIADFLPITFADNSCIDCHDTHDMIGMELEEGDPTPAPISHYTDLRRTPDVSGDTLIGSRYVCTQCHTPQDDASPLVENVYRQ